MVDFRPMQTRSTIDRVQAVTLGQPVVERAGSGGGRGADRSILSGELRSRCAAMRTAARVHDAVAPRTYTHSRAKVRQRVQRTRSRDRERAAGVETEEEHARLAFSGHIGADVELRKF